MSGPIHTGFELGIIIPTFNRATHLQNLLGQLEKQLAQIQIAVLVVVVDDGSTDETQQMLTSFEHLVNTVKGNGQWWFTRCAQEGCLYAIEQGSEHLQIINDDCVLDEYFIQNTLNHIRASVGPLLFAPISVTYATPARIMFGGVRLQWFGLKRKRTFKPLEIYQPSKSCIPSDVLPGRGMTFSTTLFQKIGGFHCALLQYHSDEDFCLRAAQAGTAPCVYTDIVLYAHHELTAAGSSYKRTTFRATLQAMSKPQSRVYLPDRWRIVRKHHSIFLAPFLFAAHIALILRANFK